MMGFPRASVLVATALAACSSFEAASTPTNGADAGAEAGLADDAGAARADAVAPPTCEGLSPATLFCSHFNDRTYVVEGIKGDLVTSAVLREPAVSTPFALWFDQAKGGTVKVEGSASGVKVLEATMLLRIIKIADDATPIMRLGVILSTGTCVVTLQPNKGTLILQSHCGQPDQNPFKVVLAMFPSQTEFVPVRLNADFAVGRATVTFGSGASTTMEFGANAPEGGRPYLAFGSAEGTGETELGYDDLVVQAR